MALIDSERACAKKTPYRPKKTPSGHHIPVLCNRIAGVAGERQNGVRRDGDEQR